MHKEVENTIADNTVSLEEPSLSGTKQKELEKLMDSIINENIEALKELAK